MAGKSMARFADTSYFLALLIPQDEFHNQAITLAGNWRGLLVTTDFVLIEVANHLSSLRSRAVFPIFQQAIAREPRMTIVPASHHWVQRGTDLYSERPDKEWPLTDCISFQVMRDEGINDALTGDHHFAQAGFNVLMKL